MGLDAAGAGALDLGDSFAETPNFIGPIETHSKTGGPGYSFFSKIRQRRARLQRQVG